MTLTRYSIHFSKVYLQRQPNHHFKRTIKHFFLARIDKNAAQNAQNTPFQVIFSSGRSLAPPMLVGTGTLSLYAPPVAPIKPSGSAPAYPKVAARFTQLYIICAWRYGAKGRAQDLLSTWVQIILGAKLRNNNLGQVVHTYIPLSPSSITWYRPRGGDTLRLER